MLSRSERRHLFMCRLLLGQKLVDLLAGPVQSTGFSMNSATGSQVASRSLLLKPKGKVLLTAVKSTTGRPPKLRRMARATLKPAVSFSGNMTLRTTASGRRWRMRSTALSASVSVAVSCRGS